jgi:hypothetical protein
MKPDKLIHLPPQQLDPNIRHELESIAKKQYWIQDPVGIDPTKLENREAQATTNWDDNKQHTEDML